MVEVTGFERSFGFSRRERFPCFQAFAGLTFYVVKRFSVMELPENCPRFEDHCTKNGTTNVPAWDTSVRGARGPVINSLQK